MIHNYSLTILGILPKCTDEYIIIVCQIYTICFKVLMSKPESIGFESKAWAKTNKERGSSDQNRPQVGCIRKSDRFTHLLNCAAQRVEQGHDRRSAFVLNVCKYDRVESWRVESGPVRDLCCTKLRVGSTFRRVKSGPENWDLDKSASAPPSPSYTSHPTCFLHMIWSNLGDLCCTILLYDRHVICIKFNQFIKLWRFIR